MNFIKLVSCNQNNFDFIWVLRFPPPNKMGISNDPYDSNHIPTLLIPGDEYECYRWRGGVKLLTKHKNNKRQRKPKGQSKMGNPGKLATLGIQDEDKQNKKHNIRCVGHHYTQANTNNVNKT